MKRRKKNCIDKIKQKNKKNKEIEENVMKWMHDGKISSVKTSDNMLMFPVSPLERQKEKNHFQIFEWIGEQKLRKS